MVRVTIQGWHEGLNKVQLNHLLRHHAGMKLKEAKHAVDRLLLGDQVTFESPDQESALAFCVSAKAIGAECSDPIDLDDTVVALRESR